MTIAIVSSDGLGEYDPSRDITPVLTKKALAAEGNMSFLREVNGLPDFVVDITTDTDTSNLQAVDLTDEGVLFPANSMRTIRGRSYCSTDNDHYHYEWEQDVYGNDGTTPVLGTQRILSGGGEENGTAVAYGEVGFRYTLSSLATPVVDYASAGLAIGTVTSGAADITVPPNRLIKVKGINYAGSLTTATAGGVTASVDVTNLDGAGVGTDALQFWAQNAGTDLALDNPIAGADHKIEVSFELWPAHNHRLVMNSNNVEVQCTAVAAIADEVLRHRVEIWVGPLKRLITHS